MEPSSSLSADLEAAPAATATTMPVTTTTKTTTTTTTPGVDDFRDEDGGGDDDKPQQEQPPPAGVAGTGAAAAAGVGFGERDIEDVIEQDGLPPSQFRPKTPQTTLKTPASGKRSKSRGGSRSSDATPPTTIITTAAAPTQPLWNRVTKGLASMQTLTFVMAALALIFSLLSYFQDETVATTVVDTVAPQDSSMDTAAAAATNVSLLDIVLERGYLKCGFHNQIVGFAVAAEDTNDDQPTNDPPESSATTTTVTYAGFDVDLCRSLSAAIVGDPDAYVAMEVSSTERWVKLNDTSVDVVFHSTHTMQRDVYVPELGTGAEFTRPYFFDGMAFGGVDEFVTCAEAGRYNDTECTDLSVCVFAGITLEPIVKSMFPADNIVLVSTVDQFPNLFPSRCNVLASGRFSLTPTALQRLNIALPMSYRVGDQLFSREPIAMVTRQGDSRWTDFVNFVLQALIYAEEQGITQATADQMPTTTLFGPQFEQVYMNALRAVGNYGELYDRHLETYVARSKGPNRLNQGDTARQFILPFGDLDLLGPELELASPTVRAIKERGFLRCGATTNDFPLSYFRDGAWQGFSNDFCRAVSAALFDGVERVLFVAHSIPERFRILQEGRIDYLPASNSWTLARDIHEPTSGAGLAYTTITVLAGEAFGGVPEFVECADNLDVFSPQCQALRVCALGNFYDNAVELLGNDFYVVEVPDTPSAFQGLVRGDCNLVYTSVGFVSPVVARSSFGVPADFDFARGKREFSVDVFGTVTREDDPLWTDFIRWVIQSLFYAEFNGITKETANLMPQTNVFGGLRVDSFAQAVGADGNFQEHWDRHLGFIVTKAENIITQYADFTEPLLFSIPGFEELDQARTRRE